MPSSSTSGGRPVAVVTAASSGIGLSSAEALAADGYYVVISSRNADHVSDAVARLHSLHGKSSASGIVCHVGSPQDRDRLLSHTLSLSSTVSVLVLNAAVSTSIGPILDTTEGEWDKMFEINVKSVFLLVQKFSPHFAKKASIIIVSSYAAYSPLPSLGVYSVSKTALLGLVKVLATELGPKDIRVNGVAPGIIQTKFSSPLWKGDDSPAAGAVSRRSAAGKVLYIPMSRIGQPSEVGGVVAFLASERASYISGETIVIAGGATGKL